MWHPAISASARATSSGISANASRNSEGPRRQSRGSPQSAGSKRLSSVLWSIARSKRWAFQSRLHVKVVVDWATNRRCTSSPTPANLTDGTSHACTPIHSSCPHPSLGMAVVQGYTAATPARRTSSGNRVG